MICPKCNLWLPDTAKFCSQCGLPRSGFRMDGAAAPPVPEPSMITNAALLPPMLLQAAGLRPGERIMQVWRAGQVQTSNDPEESDTSVPVVLLATEQRLVVVREKGLMSKSYKPQASYEYREIVSYDLTSMLRVKGLNIYTQGRFMRSRTEYVNLCEADPATLRPVAPLPVERTRALLEGLIGRR